MPEFTAHNIWPTPIYKNEIPLEPRWVSYCEQAPCKRTNSNNGWISTNFDILNTDELIELKHKIFEHLNVYLLQHLKINNRLRLTTSWITKHDKGDFAQIHSHQNSLISGVFYLKTKENCGDLYFERNIGSNSFLSESFRFDLIEETFINSNRHKIDVYDGLLLLFPSTLKHGTPVMPLDNYTRIAISFNTFLSGPTCGEDLYLEA